MKLTERFKLNFSGIYLLKNKISGHCYVGQAKNINKRIYGHLKATIDETFSDYNYPIHVAMRKYGVDNFDLEVLEACEVKKLDEQEQY